MLRSRRLTALALTLAALLLASFTSGCGTGRYTVAYPRDPAPQMTTPPIGVVTFADQRPDDERTGARGGFLNTSTYDKLYTDSVTIGFTENFVRELRARGVEAGVVNHPAAANYIVEGEVLNFRAIQIPPRSSFLPYVNYVTWMWTNDILVLGVRCRIKFTDRNTGTVALDRIYEVTDDTQVWVGFLNLNSRVKGLTREDLVRLAQAGMQQVLGLAADEIAGIMRPTYAAPPTHGDWIPPAPATTPLETDRVRIPNP